MRPIQENDVFHAIAHPARRAILVTLKHGERAASDLAAPFHMSFAAVSMAAIQGQRCAMHVRARADPSR
jgi:DNA-binding transcriptional ArsR family regulator